MENFSRTTVRKAPLMLHVLLSHSQIKLSFHTDCGRDAISRCRKDGGGQEVRTIGWPDCFSTRFKSKTKESMVKGIIKGEPLCIR